MGYFDKLDSTRTARLCVASFLDGLSSLYGSDILGAFVIGDVANDEFNGWWSVIDVLTIKGSAVRFDADGEARLEATLKRQYGWIGCALYASHFTGNHFLFPEGRFLRLDEAGADAPLLLRAREPIGVFAANALHAIDEIAAGIPARFPKLTFERSLALCEDLRDQPLLARLVHPEFRWKRLAMTASHPEFGRILNNFLSGDSGRHLYLRGDRQSGSGKSHFLHYIKEFLRQDRSDVFDFVERYGKIEAHWGVAQRAAAEERVLARLENDTGSAGVFLLDEVDSAAVVEILARNGRVIFAGHNPHRDFCGISDYNEIDVDRLYGPDQKLAIVAHLAAVYGVPDAQFRVAVDYAVERNRLSPGDIIALVSHAWATVLVDRADGSSSDSAATVRLWEEFLSSTLYWKWLRDPSSLIAYRMVTKGEDERGNEP